MPDSYLGNLATTRSKMSAIRQRLGLESSAGTGLRELAPSPVNGPAPVRSAAQRAVQEQPDFDPDKYQIPPEKEQLMLSQIQAWIDENHNGIDDRQESGGAASSANPAVQPIPAAPPEQQATPAAAPAQAPTLNNDPRVNGALSPVADFFKANGRMPTYEELQRQGAKREVTQVLGREPTDEEINLYMMAPAKGLQIKEKAV